MMVTLGTKAEAKLALYECMGLEQSIIHKVS